MSFLKLLKRKIVSDFDADVLEAGPYTFLNPYSYLFFRKEWTLLSKSEGVYVDGIALVYAFKAIGIKCERFSFDMTSIAAQLFEKFSLEHKSVYFVGSTEAEIQVFAAKIKSQYPTMKIFGCRNGYFENDAEIEVVFNEIASLSPDVVVCGMGAGKQESFIVGLHEHGFKGASFSCGGFIHQTAISVDTKYYPEKIDSLNLRWLYRMFREPKLVKRYAFCYPKFVFCFLLDVWEATPSRLLKRT